MSILDRLRVMTHRGAHDGGAISANSRSVSVLQPSGTLWAPLLGLDFDDYKANFSDIRPIVEQFAMVAPYAVDSNGQELTPQPNAIQKLYDPNDDMGFYDFADYLASTVLSQSRAIVKVIWANDAGGNLDRIKRVSDNIAGYIFLPPSSRQVMSDGSVRYQYQTHGNITEYCDSRDVMEFYYSMSTDAYGVGVSPAQASKKWATIEDYIAAYQAGFFQNGAKPDGMFIVTANSYEDYQSAVEKLENVHKRGSRGHWNYQYAYRPTDENGNPLNGSSIEWVSFGGTNRDLALDTLIKNVQDKKDSVYGVPAIARGNDATATYNNAQVSDRNLARKIDYLLRRTWSRFQHELARVCEDDISWHISYTFEVPALADADKVQAETDATNVNSLITLVNAGASVQDACRALGLNRDWATLTLTKQETPTALPIGENKHFLTINSHADDVRETAVKRLVKIVNDENRRVANLALENQGVSVNDYTPTDEEVETFAKAMRDALNGVAELSIAENGAELIRQSKLRSPEVWGKNITNEQWFKRLRQTAWAHDNWTAARAMKALQEARDKELTMDETRKLLEDKLFDKDTAEILARNEVVNCERYGRLESAKEIADTNDMVAIKTWMATEDARTCAFCRAMNGKSVALNKPFANKGDVVELGGDDGVAMVDFVDLDVPDAHNNCRCAFAVSFKRKE